MSRKRKNAKQYQGADRFTKAAREAGFPARSVFKLEEIQRRTRLIKQGNRVLDLGCYPGSWSRFSWQHIGRRGALVGVDLEVPEGLSGTFLERSALEVSAEELLEALGGPADVVLSDMAPLTTGDRFGDHVRQVALAQVALDLGLEVLRPGGNFCVKVFAMLPALRSAPQGASLNSRQTEAELLCPTSLSATWCPSGECGSDSCHVGSGLKELCIAKPSPTHG